jgi:hypothetical protein
MKDSKLAPIYMALADVQKPRKLSHQKLGPLVGRIPAIYSSPWPMASSRAPGAGAMSSLFSKQQLLSLHGTMFHSEEMNYRTIPTSALEHTRHSWPHGLYAYIFRPSWIFSMVICPTSSTTITTWPSVILSAVDTGPHTLGKYYTTELHTQPQFFYIDEMTGTQQMFNQYC